MQTGLKLFSILTQLGTVVDTTEPDYFIFIALRLGFIKETFGFFSTKMNQQKHFIMCQCYVVYRRLEDNSEEECTSHQL